MAYSVLVVEDTLINQRMLMSLLPKKGYNVVLATNGQEALDALAKEHFDIILMDMNMPVMDGATAIKAIRQQGVVPGATSIPIIALSALHKSDTHLIEISPMVDAWLPKPFDFEELEAEMKKLLNNQTI